MRTNKHATQQAAPYDENLKPLNFKVPAGFHREFKTHAAMRGMTMQDLLREGFELSKKQHGPRGERA